ncbi:MAG TPA: vitamin K epoxide reductase family protein [Pyrinomonadaceae bacterium]|nr:vitamin K epoxide reductase family protein [Pyrinomonadaceae bacterium]
MSAREHAGEVGAVGSADGTNATRRGRLLDMVTAAVALVGLADALYLTVQHLSGRSVICVATTGCDKVLQSHYATLPGGYPLAALGAVAYFTVFSLATLSAFGHRAASKLLAPVVALMLLSTLYLLYLQAFVIEAFCSYCLLSAAVTTVLTALVVSRLVLVRRD